MILLVTDDREYLCEPGEELHTDLGVVDVPLAPSEGDTVDSHLGETFHIRRLRGPDLFDHLERSGAPMMPRDIGLIIGMTGAEESDRVLDAGTGTGVLAAYLGRLGARVVTYEKNPSAATTAMENMRLAGVAEVVDVRTGDVTAAVDSMAYEFDLLTLDTADAPEVVRHAPSLLTPGGFVAVYSPFVEDARAVSEAATASSLSDIQTIETIQREMDFDDRGSRPSTHGVGHTGYLTIARQ